MIYPIIVLFVACLIILCLPDAKARVAGKYFFCLLSIYFAACFVMYTEQRLLAALGLAYSVFMAYRGFRRRSLI